MQRFFSEFKNVMIPALAVLKRVFGVLARIMMYPATLFALSFLLIFFCSRLYMQYSVARLRCHQPSDETWGHLWFEVLPLALLVIVIAACILMSFAALRASRSVIYTLGVVVLAFTYSVCCFALIYHQFGLLELTNASDIAFLQIMMLQELLNGGANVENGVDLIEQGVNLDGFAMNFHQTGIELEIARDPATYFAYSLSTVLPGMPVYKPVVLCPSAYLVGVAQSVTNVIMGLITVVLVARVGAAHSQDDVG